MNCIHYDVRGRVAVIVLDNPPVNGLGHALRSAIVDGLERALADSAVHAILLIGSDRLFSGGADIREFDTDQGLAEPSLLTVIDRVENAPKPVVVAMGGVCMGGAIELAAAAHFRVAKTDASIALPEVKLGLLPGAGGTQRLPRLVGLELATELIVGGDPLPAQRFAGTRFVDALIDGNLLSGALGFAEQVIDAGREVVRTRELRIEHADPESFFRAARERIAATAGPFPAPLKCLDALRAAMELEFDAGWRVERRLFEELLRSPESRALRHAFFAERAAARLPGIADDTPVRPVDRVGVVGAGTMGAGIAMCFVNAGIAVTLVESSAPALERGLASIRGQYESRVRRGRMAPEALERRMVQIRASLELESLGDCDLIVEAVFEDMSVKEAVFRRLDAVARPGAILATNTSTLDVNRIAACTGRPGDVVGMHFFSPANVMRLLEVVRGAATAPDVLVTVMRLARRIGKVAVVAGVCDGFIGNRMIDPYMKAASWLVEHGATPWQVDVALERFGMAMGPFRMADLAGNDIGWAIRKRRYALQPPQAPDVADRLCEQGRFGQKVGRGWYRYEPGGRSALPDPDVESLLATHRRELGIDARAFDDADIVERCIYALFNEGARVLDDGIAARASDIDVVYLNGYGFPAHRGGPMHYASEVGLAPVVRRLESFAADDARIWRPAASLVRRAREGRSLA